MYFSTEVISSSNIVVTFHFSIYLSRVTASQKVKLHVNLTDLYNQNGFLKLLSRFIFRCLMVTRKISHILIVPRLLLNRE